MKYEVFARKWRPHQFSDVVGQEHVTGTLQNAIKMDRLAHAYLLVGPRGIGKTSIARIFAKALNCEKGPTVQPCDKCDSCREIALGTNLDVQEIDGASNNSVDQVRDLRDTVKYAPTKGNFKIYIIDEVHMLSTAAFNALLKTLEEPPPHVKFIFATTEPEKMLPTILSRCQRYDLRRIPVQLIVERLREICSAESIEAEDDALVAVARGSEGGLRDAESALDQLVSFRGSKIGEDDVLSVFGLTSRKKMEELVDELIDGKTGEMLKHVDELDRNGKDLQRVVFDLISYFRDMLVCIHAGKDSEFLGLMAGQEDVLIAQAKKVDTEKILRLADILTEAENKMRYALSKKTLLETALIKCSRAVNVASVGEILKLISEMREGVLRDIPQIARESSVSYEKKNEVGGVDSSGIQILTGQWPDIVERAGKMALMVRDALKDAKPLSVDGSVVKIGFEPEFESNIKRFNVSRNRKALERVLGQVLKRQVSAEFVISEATNMIPEPENIESGKAETTAVEDRHDAKKQRTKRDIVEDPVVQKTLEIFNGSIVDIRE